MSTDLEHYLEYYTTDHLPGYAVLVTGDWGVGKTHQVKHCLTDTKHLYISLFGLPTVDAIRLAVLSTLATHNVDLKGKSITNVLPELGNVVSNLEPFKPLGRLAQGVAESLLTGTLRENYVIVFDDLERSTLKTKDLLGVLNHYIEDLRIRVIIISNEQKLKPSFRKFKEKLIGQTIHISPQVTDAYKAFVSELDTPALQSFATDHRDLVLRLFADSDCRSLRVLRQVLHDLARLANVLADRHLVHSSAIIDIVSNFCARDLEFRLGHIDEGDMRAKYENPYAFLFEEQAESGTHNKMSRIIKSESKFPLVNFQSDIFNIEVILDMLVKGRFVKEDILESIDASAHFQNPNNLPPWKVIVQFEAFDNGAVERAIERMKKQIQDYKVTDIGELLHVFSLMMTLSDNEVIDQDIPDILSFAKSYVDYLTEHNMLSTIDEVTLRNERTYHSYEGYAYHVPNSNAQQFNELKDYVITANRMANQRKLPQTARDLLKLMETDVEQFLEQVCHTNSDNHNSFASVPILVHIPPARFVESWMHSPIVNWPTIATALDIRYEYLIQHSELNDEREWAIRVYRKLQREEQSADGLTAWRLRRIIPKALKVLAGDADISELRC